MRFCLGYLASLLLLVVVVVGLVLYIGYGPRSVVLGFVVGVGLVAAIAWLGFHYPSVLALTNARSIASLSIGSAARTVIQASDDPRLTALAVLRVVGWLITIVFAGATLLFATFAIALRLRGELTSGMVAAAALCGASLALTVICFRYLARAGL